MYENHETYIKEVNKLEERSVIRGEKPFACVIIDRETGENIGSSHHAIHLRRDPTQHAVIVAIGNACHSLFNIDLSNCIAYITSEPCIMCSTALQYANILEVHYCKNI
jgi:tRNA(Arg) A34 adenosine deaminase TadA